MNNTLIYFYDGILTTELLLSIPHDKNDENIIIIDGKYGTKKAFSILRDLKDIQSYKNKSIIILTNMTDLLDNNFAWNKKIDRPNIFMKDTNERWVNIQELTDKEIRKPHNVRKIYLANGFNNFDD